MNRELLMFGVLAGAAYVAYRLVAPSLGVGVQSSAQSSGAPTVPAGIRSIGAPYRDFLPTANAASNLATVGWRKQPAYAAPPRGDEWAPAGYSWDQQTGATVYG